MAVHTNGDEKAEQQQQYSSGEVRYRLVNTINSGTYGVVYRGLDMMTGEIVAIKHEKNGLSRSTRREMGILAALPRHPCIVGLRDVMVDEWRRVFVVMEYMESDLRKWIRDPAKPRMTLSEIKWAMKKILQGVEFLHGMGVMHRDLKPANILINARKGELKICDFGLSRPESKSGDYTTRVGTSCYRAPELLLGHTKYTTAIDMWSVGCIMAELLLRDVLFRAKSDIQQLNMIYATVGKSPYHLHLRVTAAVCVGGMPVLTSEGADLLESLLAFNPKDRITATEALNHAWFKEFYGLVSD